MAQPTDIEKGFESQAAADDRNEQKHDQPPPPLSPPAPEPAPAPAPATPSPTKKKSNFGDSSGPLFSLYSDIADEEDEEMATRWQQDAKDILIFTGLFSASVSVLLAVSVLDLKPNSQDISAVYLANIFQVLARADLNITLPPMSIPPIPSPEPFSPPRSAIWVNSLWFLSLVINLTCALLATSLHQWSRRYTRFTHPSRCGPEKRARLRAFFRGGMDNMYLPSTVEALPALIHLSLFLFFSGLAVFLFNINHGVFLSVVWWIVGFTAAYGWMTVMPIFRHDSPYYAPLSSTAWTLHAIVSYTLYRVLAFVTSGYFGSFRIWLRFCRLSKHYRDRISCHVQKVAEETTLTQSSDLDLEILDCTIGGALGDDESLEEFFEAIPGFFKSPLVKDIKGSLRDKPEVRSKIVDSLEGFMERNLSSNAVSEEVNIRRLIICMNATKEIGESRDIYRIISKLSQGTLGEDDNMLEKLFDIIIDFFKSIPEEDLERDQTDDRLWYALDGLLCRTLPAGTVTESVKTRRLDVYLNAIKVIYGHKSVDYALFDILGGEFGQLPPSMEIAYTLSRWCADHQDIPHMVRIAPTWVADTLIRAPTRKRDEAWIAFVKHQFDSSDDVLSSEALQKYIAHNDNSVLLAIFNHVARQVIRTGSWGWDMDVLSSLSTFDIRDTQPELRNDFCALWNQIVQMATDIDADYCFYLLRWIRHLYIALHQGTDAAPTAFNTSTKDKDDVLSRPSSYPLCNIATHHPHSHVPHPTQPIPGSSAAPQQAEGAHVISELLALPAQHSPSPSSKSNPVHGPPQATVPSIQEFVQTFGPDLKELVSNLSKLVSLLSSQSSLSNYTTKIGRNDEPTPDIRIKVDPVPVTVTPSIIIHPSSVSVERVPHKRQDTTVSHAGSDITLVSSDATEIPPSISIASVALQASGQSTGVPPTTVSDPQSSLIVALPSTSSVIPTEPPPSVESTVVQPDPLSHPFGSLPSTSTTAHSHIASQVSGPSVLDVPVTRSIGGLGSHGQHETRDPNQPAPTEASLRVQQTGSSTLREA